MVHICSVLCYRLLGSHAGDYQLSITNSDGEALKGSPFAIRVQAGLVSAVHSSMQMVHGESIVAGTEAQLKLSPCDQYGNKVLFCTTTAKSSFCGTQYAAAMHPNEFMKTPESDVLQLR